MSKGKVVSLAKKKHHMSVKLNPHVVTLFLVPSRYGASLNVSHDGSASIAIGDAVYHCGIGLVDWKRVYEEFVSDTRNIPFTVLGGEVRPVYLYWAMVLSVSESEVTIEARVNEQMARKKTLISMGNEHYDTDTDFTPTFKQSARALLP